MLDKATIGMLKKIVLPFIGGKLPSIQISCADKEINGLVVDGRFISFAAVEKEIAEIGLV